MKFPENTRLMMPAAANLAVERGGTLIAYRPRKSTAPNVGLALVEMPHKYVVWGHEFHQSDGFPNGNFYAGDYFDFLPDTQQQVYDQAINSFYNRVA